ncbi:hypothetical protein OROMI_021068 [Orobanche minor]
MQEDVKSKQEIKQEDDGVENMQEEGAQGIHLPAELYDAFCYNTYEEVLEIVIAEKAAEVPGIVIAEQAVEVPGIVTAEQAVDEQNLVVLLNAIMLLLC